MLKQKQKKSEKRLGRCLFALCFLALAAGACHLYVMNGLSVKGFALADRKARISQLEKENQELELAAMRLEAYSRISQRAGELKLVRVDKVQYVTVAPPAVAKR